MREFEYDGDGSLLTWADYRGVKRFYVENLDDQCHATSRTYFDSPEEALDFGKRYLTMYRTGEKQ